MAYRDIEKRRRTDLARFHRRNEARRAAGLCLKCGKTEPAPERTLCEPCLEKRRAADRARTARLRAEGKPRRDPAQAKRYERERSRRQHAERKAGGICTKCGKVPPAPERTLCEPCAEQHRARDRARHARAKAEGIPYGGRDPEARRRAGRKRSRRRSEARRAAGLCIRCGNVPPEEGRAMCKPCREDRRQAKRDRHAERRAAGVCVNCATPAPGGKGLLRSLRRNPLQAAEPQGEAGGRPPALCRAACQGRLHQLRQAGPRGGTAYCAPCAVAKAERRDREAEYAAKRRRYAERRVRGHCVECDAPSPGVARCEPCSRKHRESSGAFRGIPLWDPSWTVIEVATGREHGPYDSEADVALCLAFAKLARDEVEVIADISPMATLTAHPW